MAVVWVERFADFSRSSHFISGLLHFFLSFVQLNFERMGFAITSFSFPF